MLSIHQAGGDVREPSTVQHGGDRTADIEHLNDASENHTMPPIAALDEEIDEYADAAADVLHAVRRLRGLRRAVEEATASEVDTSLSPQEVLQRTAVLPSSAHRPETT